jgi:hypothetical protein
MELYSRPRDWLAGVECPVCQRPYRRFTLTLKGDRFPCATCGTNIVKRFDAWPLWLAVPWVMIGIIGCFTVLVRFQAGMLYSAMWLLALGLTFPHHITLEETSAMELEQDFMQYPIGRILVFSSFGFGVLFVAALLFRPLLIRLAVILG